MPARLRSLPIGIPKARSTSSDGMTREPVLAAEEMTETLAVFVGCFSCFPGARWVIRISSILQCRSIFRGPISIFASDFDYFLAKENGKN